LGHNWWRDIETIDLSLSEILPVYFVHRMYLSVTVTGIEILPRFGAVIINYYM